MAKLPQYTQQVVKREFSPGAAPVERSMSQALGQAAQGVGQFARAQDVMAEREARDYTIQNQNQMTVGLENERVRLTNEAKSGSDYIAGLESYIAQAKATALESAPNKKASTAITEYYDMVMAKETVNAIPVASKMNAQKTAAITKEALQLSFNSTQRNVDSYEEDLIKGSAIIETSDIPESQKGAAVTAYQNELTYYRFRGLVGDNPSRALNELESGEWDARLTPDQVNQLTNAAQQQIKSVQAATKQKLSDELNNYFAYKNSGGEETRAYTEDSLKAVYGDREGAELFEKVQDVNSFAANYQKIKLATPEQIEKLLGAETVTGPEDFIAQSRQQSTMIAAINERNKQLSNDPALYVMQSDNVTKAFDEYSRTGNGAQFAATTIAEQKNLGVPGEFVSVLSKPQASQMVNQYNQGDENAAEFMQGLREQFGDHFPIVIRDLTGAGLSPNAATVAVLPSGSRAATYLAMADKEGYKALKETLPKDDYSSITDNVMNELEDFNDSSYSVGTRNQVKQSVEILAMKYLSSGLYDSGEAATEAAANDVVNSRYEYLDTYRVPTEANFEMIERGVDRLLPKVAEMSLMPPRSATLTPELAEQSYKASLKPKAVTSNDDSGVYLYDNQNEPILDKDGRLIFYTWAELEDIAVNDKYFELRGGR